MPHAYPPSTRPKRTAESDDGQFGVKAQQIASACDPYVSLKAMVEGAPRRRAYVGRPYLVWRDDIELARSINERLAASPRDATD